MKPYFLDMYTANKVYLPNLPSFGSLEIPVDNVTKDGSPDQIPALVSHNFQQLFFQRLCCVFEVIAADFSKGYSRL